ncbi:MarR family winged helix-turn-helix transcriptional regulator [Evansella cellulosilytica]|uniref:Transcriptional regulator, MarR family n=1 Tax=Evansella cellulosilytica (strain ATCC 21833 / DSM 2522 / FERM P-1141 / JCM 9156 / N-4) TaxID=649639 RepID=E6TZD1_EVAC2|nr:MarR family transcriptional regulator [Evansella cellulosilytica]ADU28993.1 transcriptional regulator, MarR family [Evansella cellulosilytica DSM 2522]
MRLSLNDYISIKIHQTDLHLTSYIKNKLEAFNIAPEQNLIMLLLWEKDGQSQHQISQKLKKDKTNIARMAVNLEQKGFVHRVNCSEDRRSVKLFLTQEGRELGEKVIPIAEDFNDKVIHGISKEELKLLEETLTKISKNVDCLL